MALGASVAEIPIYLKGTTMQKFKSYSAEISL